MPRYAWAFPRATDVALDGSQSVRCRWRRCTDALGWNAPSALSDRGDVTELDRPFVKPKTKLRLWDMDFGKNEIITVSRINDSTTIHVISPLLPSIQGTLGIFAFVFVVSILVSLFSARQMRHAIKKALHPMNQLHAEIKGLANDNEQDSTPIQIRELEEIRTTVLLTKVALENAKDELAESKAKKLSSDAYKRLIHDLHKTVRHTC